MAYAAVTAYDAVPNSEPVIPPKTLKLPVAEKEPDVNIEPVKVSWSALVENAVVPTVLDTFKLPEILTDPVVFKLPVIVEPLTTFSEFKDASEPDTMTFFQFGIPMFWQFVLWLDTYTYAVYMPTSLAGQQCCYI